MFPLLHKSLQCITNDVNKPLSNQEGNPIALIESTVPYLNLKSKIGDAFLNQSLQYLMKI